MLGKAVRTPDGVISRKGAGECTQVINRSVKKSDPFNRVGGGSGSQLPKGVKKDRAHNVVVLVVLLAWTTKNTRKQRSLVIPVRC